MSRAFRIEFCSHGLHGHCWCTVSKEIRVHLNWAQQNGMPGKRLFITVSIEKLGGA